MSAARDDARRNRRAEFALLHADGTPVGGGDPEQINLLLNRMRQQLVASLWRRAAP